MDPKEKIKLLGSLPLLEHVPEKELTDLAQFLEPRIFKDGDVVFDQGAKGNSLFFISSGNIRILKKGRSTDQSPFLKELSILSPGDCFGEMTLFDEAPRSARAVASGNVVLFELARKELQVWLKSNPALAMGFFTELTQVLSKRLRRSSNELTLLFDLSRWLLEPIASGNELLQKILEYLIPYLEGSWTAGAFIYNEFNNEIEVVASTGDFTALMEKLQISATSRMENAWFDDKTYLVFLPGEKHLLGYFIFRHATKLNLEEQNEFGRTLATAGRLTTAGLANINFRTEQSLRARLNSSRHYASGL